MATANIVSYTDAMSANSIHPCGSIIRLGKSCLWIMLETRSRSATQPTQICTMLRSSWRSLGASSYTYAEAQPSQELVHWIGGHVRAFTFFGWRSANLVPDNLKQGVRHPSWYEPDLNPTYLELAQYYEWRCSPRECADHATKPRWKWVCKSWNAGSQPVCATKPLSVWQV